MQKDPLPCDLGLGLKSPSSLRVRVQGFLLPLPCLALPCYLPLLNTIALLLCFFFFFWSCFLETSYVVCNVAARCCFFFFLFFFGAAGSNYQAFYVLRKGGRFRHASIIDKGRAVYSSSFVGPCTVHSYWAVWGIILFAPDFRGGVFIVLIGN